MEWQPFSPSSTDGYPRRSAWNRGVATLSDEVLARWELTPVAIVSGGASAIVMRVEQADGTPAVLKVGFPHEEARWEAVALESFGGDLACRVLRQDTGNWALLLEEVSPGESLGASVLAGALSIADAATVGAALRERVGASAIPEGVPALGGLMERYAADAAGTLETSAAEFERLGATALAATALRTLAGLAAEHPQHPVLLHGDYNPANILRSGDGWRLIDPKPLVGEAAADLWQLVAQLGDPLDAPAPEEQFAATLAAVAVASGEDAGRIARWGLGRTAVALAWAVAEGDTWEAPIQARALDAWAAVQV
jgi:streptomycin 6-kinase